LKLVLFLTWPARTAIPKKSSLKYCQRFPISSSRKTCSPHQWSVAQEVGHLGFEPKENDAS
jgi:hypothetical protein